MQIEIVFLIIVFMVILMLMTFKRPLYQAISGGLLTCAVLYKITPDIILECIYKIVTDWGCVSVLVSLYLITYLQQMLITRKMIKAAENDLNYLFRSKRKSILSTSFFFGLLPSAASTILLGDIVKESTDEYLDVNEQAFVTSWYRHIPESFIPTYSFIILFATLSNVKITNFILCMIVPVIFMFLVGYFPYIKKLPKDAVGLDETVGKKQAFTNLLQHMWPILLILILIVVFDIPVVTSAVISIIATVVAYKFKINELMQLGKAAFELKMLLNSFLCLIFKEFIAYSGALDLLPDTLAKLPIPTYLVFALLFFIGGFVNVSAIIAIGTPLAFSTLSGGAPLMMLLMSICHAANQLSPTHICVVLAAEHFKIPLGNLIRKVLPRALIYCVFVILYYNILIMF